MMVLSSGNGRVSQGVYSPESNHCPIGSVVFRATVNTVINTTINHTALLGGLRNHDITEDRALALNNMAMQSTATPRAEDVTSRL